MRNAGAKDYKSYSKKYFKKFATINQYHWKYLQMNIPK